MICRHVRPRASCMNPACRDRTRCGCSYRNRRADESVREWVKDISCMWHWMCSWYYTQKATPLPAWRSAITYDQFGRANVTLATVERNLNKREA